jgi:hypothetical protein
MPHARLSPTGLPEEGVNAPLAMQQQVTAPPHPLSLRLASAVRNSQIFASR